MLAPKLRNVSHSKAKTSSQQPEPKGLLLLLISMLTNVSLNHLCSTAKVFTNPQRPDGRARRGGILCLPGDRRPETQDRVEQEGEESQQPEI